MRTHCSMCAYMYAHVLHFWMFVAKYLEGIFQTDCVITCLEHVTVMFKYIIAKIYLICLKPVHKLIFLQNDVTVWLLSNQYRESIRAAGNLGQRVMAWLLILMPTSRLPGQSALWKANQQVMSESRQSAPGRLRGTSCAGAQTPNFPQSTVQTRNIFTCTQTC